MNSYNHYAYGAVCQWLLEGVAGFRPAPEAPGFEHIIFEPTIIDGLSPVLAHHDSPRGMIRAGWTVEGDQVRYEIEVPQGTRGTLRLAEAYRGARLDGTDIADGAPLMPGKHSISFTYAPAQRQVRVQSNVNAATP